MALTVFVFCTIEGLTLSSSCGAGVGVDLLLLGSSGISQANVDWSAIFALKRVAKLLQDCYAERMGGMYIINVRLRLFKGVNGLNRSHHFSLGQANWLYYFVHKIVSPFIDKRTLARVLGLCFLLRNITSH